MRSAEFLIGLLDQGEQPGVSAEDLDGPHADIIRAWQDLGFVAREPGMNPVPSCPHCGEGVPYPVGGRYLCHACRSAVDPRHLLLWPLRREALHAAVAGHLGLRDRVERVDDCLWQLGEGEDGGEAVACFYRGTGVPSERGQRRLAAYRRLLVLHGPVTVRDAPEPGRWVPLALLFTPDGRLAPVTLAALVEPRGVVRFESHSGALWAGDALLGELPVGSRESHLLACLAEQLDHFVPYSDLKREVLRRSGSTDSADEATFCHTLKRRIKKKYVADIDRLVVTTNKADGYRLRGYAAGPW
jgi:hypothetical protein